MNQSRWRTIAYWVTTLFGPASFIIGGTLFLTGAEQPVEQMKHLGFPLYLLTILGVWKLLGAIAVVIPRTPLLKEWAYAGFFFHLSGAAAVHALAGDALSVIAQPLVFLALTIASYLLRPASRRLKLQ
ncbi:DoxX family protein [Paenibacillus gansuensis]|uniref:DoxX family protein n=1 Tax=Paenibacillus gansuensis TaxID=306542 RepID=A0ABW5PL18_9BACL